MKLVERHVLTGPNTGVPQPSGLQPTSREQPVNQQPQPTFLQLTPLLRINPLSIGLDKRHHLGISDHEVGVARHTPRGKNRPACSTSNGVG
jgi:hypothetical protein